MTSIFVPFVIASVPNAKLPLTTPSGVDSEAPFALAVRVPGLTVVGELAPGTVSDTAVLLVLTWIESCPLSDRPAAEGVAAAI